MVDQARADFLGCYGNQHINTPNIDALAARGTRFDRLYVANPFCMPARSAIMTGRMPSANGARTNGTPLSVQSRTFVSALLENGYDTALIGKCHLQNMTGLPRAYTSPSANKCSTDADGYPDQPTRTPLTGGDYDNENSVLWRERENHQVKTPYYGFDHVDLCTLHGDNVGASYPRWLNEKNENAANLKGAKNALDKGDISTPQAWRTAVPEEEYPTAYIGQKTVDLINTHDGNNPFFIQCSFPDPHHPFTPPGKYWGMYDPDDIELPKSFNKGRSPILDHLRAEYESGTANRETTLPYVVNEKEAREAIALTYGMLSMIDDWVGNIINTLKKKNLFENTVIIFASDHGDYMADHGIMLKGPIHTQGLIRTPFIWSDPSVETAKTVNNMCSGIDIAPTVLERSETPFYYGIQGKSLNGLMRGTREDHRNEVLIEDDREVIYLGFTEPQRVRTMITENHRMTLFHPSGNYELYDLKNDPDELENIWDKPGHEDLTNRMTKRMLQLICEMQDWSPLPTGRA
tara:strand:+ start:9510 stop:11066 length:1557 start_codon:yes stop_codon:yes gene_type:complete